MAHSRIAAAAGLVFLLASSALAQMTVEVTPTVWSIEVRTILPLVKINVPASINPRDYVALVAPGAPTTYEIWEYASKAENGILKFENLKPGIYEARLLSPTGAPGTNLPGKLIAAKTLTVPPPPTPVEIDSQNRVVITRRAVAAGSVNVQIPNDKSDIQVTADQGAVIKVTKP